MKQFDYFKELEASLQEAVAHKKGQKRCYTVVKELPVPIYGAADVARVRQSFDLSQRGFAALLGVSSRTVEGWECGRTVPSGAAKHLIYLFETDHSLIDKLIQRDSM